MKNDNSTKKSNASKPMLANRYFIVFYIGNIYNGRVTGYMNFTTYEGCYLNKAMTLIQLGDKNSELKEIVITNIIELSESDYREWAS